MTNPVWTALSLGELFLGDISYAASVFLATETIRNQTCEITRPKQYSGRVPNPVRDRPK